MEKERVFSYFMQSVILPVPAACSNLVGIFNKEISFVLDYEGHFEIDPIQLMVFEILFVIYISALPLFFLLCVFISPSYTLTMNAILVVTADEHYINHRGNKACKWRQGWVYSDKVMPVEEIQRRKS